MLRSESRLIPNSENERPESSELIKALTDWFSGTGILNQRLGCNPLKRVTGLFERIHGYPSPEISYPRSIVSKLEEFFLTQDLLSLPHIDGNLYIALVGRNLNLNHPV